MELIDAIEMVLQLIKKEAKELTPEQLEACNTLEDFAVNQLGED